MSKLVSRFVVFLFVVMFFSGKTDIVLGGEPEALSTGTRLAQAAMAQVGVTLIYDPDYVRLDYPMGDPPIYKGVCTDVVVRAFRKINVDLQKEIHEDMLKNFKQYPNLWGLKKPDSHIDHRRVQNIQRYMKRKGKEISMEASYLPGDIVAWRLDSGHLHIGIISTRKVRGKNHYRVVHNIGLGARNEDVLNKYTIIGHYRWN